MELPFSKQNLHKSKKDQQITDIYYCQCGKNYLTFSALYLHARNKHEIKLTTRRNSSNCKIQKHSDKTTFTYYISNKDLENLQQQIVINNSKEKHIQKKGFTSKKFLTIIKIINEYLDQENNHSSNKNQRNFIIQQLKAYFQSLSNLQLGEYPAQAQHITLYFNDFIAYYLPSSNLKKHIPPETLQQAENKIIKFWQWLRLRQYTSSLLLRIYPTPIINSNYL